MLIRGLENPDIFILEILGFLYLMHLAVQTRAETFATARRITKRHSKTFESQS